jgi:hypothetical protein
MTTAPLFQSNAGVLIAGSDSGFRDRVAANFLNQCAVEISSSGADALEKLEHSDVAGITVTNLADSAADINFTWQLYQNGAGMISQVASASSPSSANQDGFGAGSRQSFAIRQRWHD